MKKRQYYTLTATGGLQLQSKLMRGFVDSLIRSLPHIHNYE
jgi:hypothetical protein